VPPDGARAEESRPQAGDKPSQRVSDSQVTFLAETRSPLIVEKEEVSDRDDNGLQQD
jgi:hypothetical protein